MIYHSQKSSTSYLKKSINSYKNRVFGQKIKKITDFFEWFTPRFKSYQIFSRNSYFFPIYYLYSNFIRKNIEWRVQYILYQKKYYLKKYYHFWYRMNYLNPNGWYRIWILKCILGLHGGCKKTNSHGRNKKCDYYD